MRNKIELQHISVSNFFSIGNTPISINFLHGVTLIYGKNLDAVSTKDVSNGAGKTTIVNAVYQCLYNRNLKDAKGKITSVSNKYTNKGYHIELTLSIGESTYTIINSREKKLFAVYKDGVAISPKGVNATLKFIEDLIGFDFNSFSGLTFLNQESLGNIIDLTNENNIVNRFFELDRVLEIQKTSRLNRKDIASELQALSVKQTSLETNLNKLKQLDNLKARPLSDLLVEKEKLLNALEKLEDGQEVKLLNTLRTDVNNLSVEISGLQREVTQLVTKRNSLIKTSTKLTETTICPLCNTELAEETHNHTLESVKAQIATIDTHLTTVRRSLSRKDVKLQGAKDALSVLDKEFKENRSKLTEELTKVNLEINTSKTLASAGETFGNKQDIENELSAITRQLEELNKEDAILLTLDKLIKKGEVLEVYLQQYTRLLMANLAKYSTYLSLPLHILPSIEKGNITFSIRDKSETKSFSQLSSGERTRVSLLILMATLKSLEQLSGININLLTLDELLGVLDDDGISLVKQLIKAEKADKSVYIINHHDEIDKGFADRELHLCKQDNITTICEEDTNG